MHNMEDYDEGSIITEPTKIETKVKDTLFHKPPIWFQMDREKLEDHDPE